MKIKKIVLFGPESTGKTALARALAEHFHTVWIPEFARSYLENKQRFIDPFSGGPYVICSQEDLAPIVLGQISWEDWQEEHAKDLLICDTNPLETKVYSDAYFGRTDDWLLQLIEKRHYDYYLLTQTDVPWTQDALRDKPDQRDQMFQLFRNELVNRNLPFAEVTGTDEMRLQNAIGLIKHFLKKDVISS